jgi:hypothetical protein
MAEGNGQSGAPHGKAGEKPPEKPEEKQPEERRYTVDELIARSRTLFKPGVSPHAVAGAFADTGKKTFTEKQANERVKSFLSKVPSAEAE